jgi:hypothetical protein
MRPDPDKGGQVGNEFLYVDETGKTQWRSPSEVRAREGSRTSQANTMYNPSRILAPNSTEFGRRTTDSGRTIVSGPTLPAQFDHFVHFPKWMREFARVLEASRERGMTFIADYNAIGDGKDGVYRVRNRGDIRAIQREVAFVGWELTGNKHLKTVLMDLNAFRASAMKAINNGELGIFNNDMQVIEADLRTYLGNHRNGLPGEAGIGQAKRDMLNGLIGTGTAVQRKANPLFSDLNPRGSVRSFRLDRYNDLTPTGREGLSFDYDKINNNRMPQQIPREAQGMPDAVDALTTDQLLRQYEENQGYLGLSTLGMREGRPVRGGAAQTRELLRRNEAISAELLRRGVREEDPQLQRALQRRGQAMPDVVAENFTAAQEATGGTLRPIAEQPENAPVIGRITPEQERSIKELDEYYRKVTPQRIKELRNDAIDSLANRLINKGIPVAEARGLATETYKKIKSRVAGASQVISGMGTSDLSRMAGTGRPAVATRKGVNPNWMTSAFEAFDSDNDLALMKAQQVARQLNKEQQGKVAAGENIDEARASGVRSATIDQGMAFVIGEKTADQKAFGSSLREDPAAPPRVYASVVEGQKFGSQGNYAVFFEWKKSTPIVATSHHHYGVGNGLTDIHASANIGDKNARSFGNPETETYDTLPSGKKVLNTRLLVGNAGIDDIRTHQLLVSIPESALSGMRAMYKKGGFSSVKSQLNNIAVSSLVGTKSQGKTKALTSKDGIPVMVAVQKNRTEAYVLNPDLRNVETITIVENKNKEKDTALIKKNLAAAFKNNGSPMPRIKVVSAESGPSGNRGRSKITDEFFNLTGKVVYGVTAAGAAAMATEEQ